MKFCEYKRCQSELTCNVSVQTNSSETHTGMKRVMNTITKPFATLEHNRDNDVEDYDYNCNDNNDIDGDNVHNHVDNLDNDHTNNVDGARYQLFLMGRLQMNKFKF
ncbi:Hypothetical predicted protein [Octopus vulgaris]|uniref:Uncharacterized protein n=1 Tax=Octopus vulgaris TaxID=6645 RepID=A0AA36F9N3_OCTVU|nr:Hypothetical predicted protein [Octopus vulgaris]